MRILRNTAAKVAPLQRFQSLDLSVLALKVLFHDKMNKSYNYS